MEGSISRPPPDLSIAMKSTLSLVLLVCSVDLAIGQNLELKKGDHICLVGNTLAERMQYLRLIWKRA